MTSEWTSRLSKLQEGGLSDAILSSFQSKVKPWALQGQLTPASSSFHGPALPNPSNAFLSFLHAELCIS